MGPFPFVTCDLAPISPIDTIDPRTVLIIAGAVLVLAVLATVLIVRGRRRKGGDVTVNPRHLRKR